MQEKVCSCRNCLLKGQPQPLSNFHRNSCTKDGFDYYCSACKRKDGSDRRKRYVQANTRAKQHPTAAQEPTPEPEIVIDVQEPAPATPLEQAYHAVAEQRSKRDLRREHGALIEENERLKNELGEVRRSQRPPEILVYRQPSWERSDAVACVAASDWHVEEPVEGASVHGLNEYNLDIAKSRAEHFFKNALRLTDIMARDTKITTLHISALGDFFSGFIHEELAANNLLAPGDAARFCKGLWLSGIDYLLRESSYELEGDFIPGNHGRMTKQMHFGDPTGTSLESVMYDSIVDRYRDNPRVRFSVSSNAMVYRRFFERFTMRLIHGYEVKYGGGVGGITIPLRKALAQWNNPIRADLTVLGHFHQFFDGGDFLVNGSMIGYNLFAQAIKASFEEPRQAFWLVHARNGGQKSVTAPIWLDDAHRAKAA